MHRRTSPARRRARAALASSRARAPTREGLRARRQRSTAGKREPDTEVRLDRCVSREPILFPKLRIDFADFPCLHCSLSARGYSPRRPAAVDRYALARDSTALARIFKGRPEGTGRRPAQTSLFGRAAHRFSARRDSTVNEFLATLPRKENSSRAPRPSSPGAHALPPGPLAGAAKRRLESKSPCRGSGIDARFPFGWPGTGQVPAVSRRSPSPLGAATPRSIDVLVEPFSTSAFEGFA